MDGRSSSVLARLQLGLERLYRVDTQLEVEDFVIDEEQRRRAGLARAPREQLLIAQHGEPDGEAELSLGLFVDPAALDNLARNDPTHRLDEGNFGDFCLAVEGVSHFVYLALCAAGQRRVSVLELELQAEVDKFVCCLLVQGTRRPDLRGRLYERVRFADDLSADERDRYRTANEEAGRYAETLERRFVRQDRLAAMLRELRAFYRMALDAKLGHIARNAA
jgi:hypothetical protein